MGIVNTETVAMMGAALAAGGNAQARGSVRHEAQKTVGQNDGTFEVLAAELKAQCPEMNAAVAQVFAGYGADKSKDVKATLKADGERLSYMIDGNKFELSGGFDRTKHANEANAQKMNGGNEVSSLVFKEVLSTVRVR